MSDPVHLAVSEPPEAMRKTEVALKNVNGASKEQGSGSISSRLRDPFGSNGVRDTT
jgi:hypothetical protein